jgi:hypothetical protein
MKTSPEKTIILTAPQGFGKTIRAEEYRQHYGCTSIVDDWHHGMSVTSGALHLTNQDPSTFPDIPTKAYELISIGW